MNSSHKKARVGARALEVIQMAMQSISELFVTTKNGNGQSEMKMEPTIPLEYLIKEGNFKLTAPMASRILDECSVPWQRRIEKHHVALFEDVLRRSTWYPSQVAFGVMDDRLYLLNGYHRLTALTNVGGEIGVQILIIPCESEAELRAHYHRFDVLQQKRSTQQTLSAIGIAEEYGLSKRGAKSVYDATGLIINRFKVVRYQQDPVKVRSVDKRLEAARQWWPVMREYERLISSAPTFVKSRLYNQGCSAVALVTLKYQPEVATEFWKGLAEDDALAKGDARKTLLDDMKRRRLETGANNQSALTASIAWNAWFDHRRLSIVKIAPNAKVRIAGTPFDGGRE